MLANSEMKLSGDVVGGYFCKYYYAVLIHNSFSSIVIRHCFLLFISVGLTRLEGWKESHQRF